MRKAIFVPQDLGIAVVAMRAWAQIDDSSFSDSHAKTNHRSQSR
jgi:hypothetical protein